jgi:hypothetical protein
MEETTKLRVQVAYDAWQLTRVSPARFHRGSYVLPGDGRSSQQYLQDASLVRLENVPPCDVCALGALLVAHTRRTPFHRVATRANIVDHLPFAEEDLDTIETLFEWRWIGGSDLAPVQVRELLGKFGFLQEVPSDMLARGLFHNLIENEGVLKLNAKLPRGGLWIEESLKDTAKQVLEKFSIPMAQETTDV